MTTIVLEHLQLELFPIGQVTVMRQDDTERGIDVERLRLFLTGRTSRWIAHLSNAGITRQGTHITRAEDIANKTISLVHGECMTAVGGDASGILTAVLQQQQCIVDELINRVVGNDADNATHGGLLNKNNKMGAIGLLPTALKPYRSKLTCCTNSPGRYGMTAYAASSAIGLNHASFHNGCCGISVMPHNSTTVITITRPRARPNTPP